MFEGGQGPIREEMHERWQRLDNLPEKMEGKYSGQSADSQIARQIARQLLTIPIRNFQEHARACDDYFKENFGAYTPLDPNGSCGAKKQKLTVGDPGKLTKWDVWAINKAYGGT